MPELKPWAYGPFELIHHAEDHLKSGSDFDKRIALIGYDNAVEVAITTFLQLHPSQRGGKTFPRKDVEQWLINYHSKLDFFAQLIQSRNIPFKITIDEIVWYHSLRNELYHSGNGMVPEIRSLEGSRASALWVFSILFDVDTEALLDRSIPSPEPKIQSQETQMFGQTELLKAVIEMEKTLRHALLSMGVIGSNTQYLSLRALWGLFAKQVSCLPESYDNTVSQAIAARNAIVHGKPTNLSSKQMTEYSAKISQIEQFISEYGVSIDILFELKAKYPRWVRDEINSVRFIQKNRTVYLEVASRKSLGEFRDEEVTRTDLSFIIEGHENVLMFSPEQTAANNAKKFVEMFGPISIINCTDLFKPESYPEIS